MHIIETKAYRFDELTEEAKERARTWYREGGFDYDTSSPVKATGSKETP